jgi:hypothetical protein
MGEAQCGLEEHKKVSRVGAGEINGRILLLKAKVYSCGSRARGLLRCIFFFLD